MIWYIMSVVKFSCLERWNLIFSEIFSGKYEKIAGWTGWSVVTGQVCYYFDLEKVIHLIDNGAEIEQKFDEEALSLNIYGNSGNTLVSIISNFL